MASLAKAVMAAVIMTTIAERSGAAFVLRRRNARNARHIRAESPEHAERIAARQAAVAVRMLG